MRFLRAIVTISRAIAVDADAYYPNVWIANAHQRVIFAPSFSARHYDFFDAEYPEYENPVAWHDPVAQITVAVQHQVPRHFSLGNVFRKLLEF